MHDCKNIDTLIPGKMGKSLEKSANFVSEKKWELCSCLSGCLSRNRKNLEFTHPFIQKHKQLIPFLEKSVK